jgi:hypothetical protein
MRMNKWYEIPMTPAKIIDVFVDTNVAKPLKFTTPKINAWEI